MGVGVAMKQYKTILFACAAIACAAMFAGCTKDHGLHLSGVINFSASSRGGLSTKTVYGDVVPQTEEYGFQALNWELNDEITIASPQSVVQNDLSANPAHASDYVIKNVESTGIPSKATVANKLANGLMWMDGIKTYDFFAVYPSVGTEGTGLTLDPMNGKVSATIPAEQPLYGEPTSKVDPKYPENGVTYASYAPDMKYAYMTAALKSFEPKDEQTRVPLYFFPAFTAFEFYISSQDDAIDLTEFEILSPETDAIPGNKRDKLAGTFTMTAGDTDGRDADHLTTAGNGNIASVNASSATSSVKADLSAADAIDDKNGLNFTVFTVPVTNQYPLRIRFTSKDGEDGEGNVLTKTSYLDLKYSNKTEAGDNAGKPVQFLAGHKYVIHMLKLPAGQWKITIAADIDVWDQVEEEIVIYI